MYAMRRGVSGVEVGRDGAQCEGVEIQTADQNDEGHARLSDWFDREAGLPRWK